MAFRSSLLFALGLQKDIGQGTKAFVGGSGLLFAYLRTRRSHSQIGRGRGVLEHDFLGLHPAPSPW